MPCMKCGVEIPEDRVFCDHCLSVMDTYPIKPGTHIHLPKRALADDPAKKAVKKKRTPTPEEQIASLRLKLLRLRLTAVILVFLLCVVSALFGLRLYSDFTQSETGRNYTIDTSMKD